MGFFQLFLSIKNFQHWKRRNRPPVKTPNGVFGGNTAHKQGILLAAHLKGTGGAIDFIKTGKNSVDGYGTSVKSYYEHGKKQYLAYQTQKKQPQSKPNQALPQTETDKTEAMLANHHLGQETPLIQEAAHYVIPALNIAQTVALDYKNIKNELDKAQKTVQVQVQQKTENSKTQSTQKVEMSSSVDPIYQFLTQDVSERRIAHIVLYAMAAQLSRENETVPEIKADPLAYGDWLDERVERLMLLPESSVIHLIGLFFSGQEQLTHLFAINFDEGGVHITSSQTTTNEEGEEALVLPARFRPYTKISVITQKLLGKFNEDV